MQILGEGELVDRSVMAGFLGECQFKFGGLAKAPGERPGAFLTANSEGMRPLTAFPCS